MRHPAGRLPVVDVAVDSQGAEHGRGQRRDRDHGGQPPADAPVDQGEPRPGRARLPRMRVRGPDHAGRRRCARRRLGRLGAFLASGLPPGQGLPDGSLRPGIRHVPFGVARSAPTRRSPEPPRRLAFR